MDRHRKLGRKLSVREATVKDALQMFAAYNAWANKIVYDAAAELTSTQFGENTGAFFGSIKGTLNHLLCADRIWLKRMTGEGDAPAALDTILHDDLPSLTEARVREDARIIGVINGFEDDQLTSDFTYTPITTPQPVTQKLGSALFHLFNHQTHHRGQCHTILTTLGHPSLTLDMVSFQRTAGRRWL